MSIIDYLHPKSNCGKDGLSTKVLKLIKNETSELVTLIINQLIATGIFSDKLKIAKLIPLLKKEMKPFLIIIVQYLFYN